MTKSRQEPSIEPILPVNPKTKQPVLFFILLLAVLTFAVYFNALSGPFLFDDIVIVKTNPLIKSLSNVPTFFKTDIFAHDAVSGRLSSSYRPLQTVSYAVDSFVWGNDPRGFHLTNILIHIANALLVFFLLRKIFGDQFFAFFVALLFGIHPANTQSVSYISGRADLISTTFVLAALFTYVDYRKTGRAFFLWSSALAFFAALYSKETVAIVVPLLIVLYEAAFIREKARPLMLITSIPYIIGFLLYLPMRASALHKILPQRLELAKIDIFSRVLTSLKTLFIDIRILAFPYDLHFGRSTEVERSIFSSPAAIGTAAGIIAAVYIVILCYKKWKVSQAWTAGVILFGMLWFFVSMIPLLNIVPLQVFHSDSWLYLPSIGIYMVFFALLRLVWQKSAHIHKVLGVFILLFISAAYLVYGYATIKRNEDYRDEIKFYLSSVQWRPNVKFFMVIGGLYGQKGDYEMAEKYLRKAIETNDIYPSYEVVAAYYNLGITYLKRGEYDKAREAFEKVRLSGSTALKIEAEKNLIYLKERNNPS